jgi:hypothetical protein
MERLVQRALLDYLDRLAQREYKETKDQLGLQGFLDHKVLQAQPE